MQVRHGHRGHASGELPACSEALRPLVGRNSSTSPVRSRAPFQKSASLKAAQELFASYLPTLKALPQAEVTRVVCGGCGDFKVIVNQPCEQHDAWKADKYAPEEEFLAKLGAIEGITRVETQEFTMEAM